MLPSLFTSTWTSSPSSRRTAALVARSGKARPWAVGQDLVHGDGIQAATRSAPAQPLGHPQADDPPLAPRRGAAGDWGAAGDCGSGRTDGRGVPQRPAGDSGRPAGPRWHAKQAG